MADIFISYAREDRQKAEWLSAALRDAGWSVWWDRGILPGSTFEQVIAHELSTARCVVVLWSAAARASNWVQVEASVRRTSEPPQAQPGSPRRMVPGARSVLAIVAVVIVAAIMWSAGYLQRPQATSTADD